jgi:hypothetical protein
MADAINTASIDHSNNNNSANLQLLSLLNECETNIKQQQHIKTLKLSAIDCGKLGIIQLPSDILTVTDGPGLLSFILQQTYNLDYLPISTDSHNRGIATKLLSTSEINRAHNNNNNSNSSNNNINNGTDLSSHLLSKSVIAKLNLQWESNLNFFVGTSNVMKYASYVHMVLMIHQMTTTNNKVETTASNQTNLESAIDRSIEWGMKYHNRTADAIKIKSQATNNKDNKNSFTTEVKQYFSLISYFNSRPWELVLYFIGHIPLSFVRALPSSNLSISSGELIKSNNNIILSALKKYPNPGSFTSKLAQSYIKELFPTSKRNQSEDISESCTTTITIVHEQQIRRSTRSSNQITELKPQQSDSSSTNFRHSNRLLLADSADTDSKENIDMYGGTFENSPKVAISNDSSSSSSSSMEYVCLGFAFSESDRIRLNQLCLISPNNVKIVAVNEGVFCQDPECLYTHRSANFSSRRGIIAAITQETTLIMFDYFWLQEGYFNDRYGSKWCSSGGQLDYLLNHNNHNNVETVILPLDLSNELQGQIDNNIAFLESFCTIQYLSHEAAKVSHPLVHSDQKVDTQIPEERGSCTFQMNKYTSKDKAFVVFRTSSSFYSAVTTVSDSDSELDFDNSVGRSPTQSIQSKPKERHRIKANPAQKQRPITVIDEMDSVSETASISDSDSADNSVQSQSANSVAQSNAPVPIPFLTQSTNTAACAQFKSIIRQIRSLIQTSRSLFASDHLKVRDNDLVHEGNVIEYKTATEHYCIQVKSELMTISRTGSAISAAASDLEANESDSAHAKRKAALALRTGTCNKKQTKASFNADADHAAYTALLSMTENESAVPAAPIISAKAINTPVTCDNNINIITSSLQAHKGANLWTFAQYLQCYENLRSNDQMVGYDVFTEALDKTIIPTSVYKWLFVIQEIIIRRKHLPASSDDTTTEAIACILLTYYPNPLEWLLSSRSTANTVQKILYWIWNRMYFNDQNSSLLNISRLLLSSVKIIATNNNAIHIGPIHKLMNIYYIGQVDIRPTITLCPELKTPGFDVYSVLSPPSLKQSLDHVYSIAQKTWKKLWNSMIENEDEIDENYDEEFSVMNGDLTKKSMTEIIYVLQNQLPEYYKLSEENNSRFVDLGSGYGLALMNTICLTQCQLESYTGIEIVLGRFEKSQIFATDCRYEACATLLLDSYNNHENAQVKQIMNNATHFYSFDPVCSADTLGRLAKQLINHPFNWRVFVSYKAPIYWTALGLVGKVAICLGKMGDRTKYKQKFTAYIYLNIYTTLEKSLIIND